MQGPINSWRRAIEQDGPGGAGKRLGADIVDAPREPRAVRRDAGERRVFLDPRVTHADRARRAAKLAISWNRAGGVGLLRRGVS